jgi:hypothetical protein
MSKTLYLPEHVAQKINKEKGEAKAEPESLKSAYVDANERVLDPSLLDKPLLERLPQPTGWRVLVMPYQGKAKTTSGLYIPDEIRERESVATVVAYVMKLGPWHTKTLISSVQRGNPGAKKVNGCVLVGILDLDLRSMAVRFALLMMTKLSQRS